MTKFVHSMDVDEDPVIINLEAIEHVLRTANGVRIYFRSDYNLDLEGAYADIFWGMVMSMTVDPRLITGGDNS